MMMIAEHWIDETSAGGRMLRPADRQAIAAFVTAHAACQVARMPAIAIGFPIWERIITAMRPQ